MPEHDDTPVMLAYEAPSTDGPDFVAFARYVRIGFWGIALALYPLFAFKVLPSTLRTSGTNIPQIYATQWAIGAVAVRAAVALARRNDSWWSITYIALYVALPTIADWVAKWW